MRGANRNKQDIWYALYDSVVEDYDEDGYQTGTHVSYGKPVKTRGNVSPAKGEVIAREFGDDDLYDRVVGPLPIDTPIDEYSVLWIDVVPQLDAQGNLAVYEQTGNAITPHNYIVRKKAPSLKVFGCVMLAVDKVSVT